MTKSKLQWDIEGGVYMIDPLSSPKPTVSPEVKSNSANSSRTNLKVIMNKSVHKVN